MNHPHILGPSTSLGGNNNSTIQASVLSDGALLSHSQPVREEIKKSFLARDGVYQIVVSAELSRPRPLPHYQMPPGIVSAAANQMTAAGSSVRVSFLNATKPSSSSPVDDQPCSSSHVPVAPSDANQHNRETTDTICFNVGKELYVYSYNGIQTETDLSRPIDKRVYKGTSPTYHVFNQAVSPHVFQLVIGFTLGQIQVIDPLEKTNPSGVSRLYNEDRYIDKTSVTCIRFLPDCPNVFYASYVSGNIYVYDDRVPAITSSSNGSSNPPSWVVEVTGEKFATYAWRSRTPRNPVTRWKIGEGSIHQFDFSPDGNLMATVSHDGFLRVFNHKTQDLLAVMKSYFGGLLSLSWSHDSLLIATGGEDDLLTVFHVREKRVVCRGQAHKSWISQVKFDHHAPFLPKNTDVTNRLSTATSSENASVVKTAEQLPCTSSQAEQQDVDKVGDSLILYRIGTVGHDTCLCFWDITKFMMDPDSSVLHRNSGFLYNWNRRNQTEEKPAELQEGPLVTGLAAGTDVDQASQALISTTTQPTQEKSKKKRFMKKHILSKFTSGGSGNTSAGGNATTTSNGEAPNPELRKKIIPAVLASQISCCGETRVLGSSVCPGIRDVPIIEPVMCKKVAHDRLTVLEFRKDCVVTACQEGYICTWARPSPDDMNKGVGIKTPSADTPESEQKPSVSATGSSYGYGSELSNGAGPSRSSSVYSN